MNCCQCQGIEELFSDKFVKNELARYRARGPIKTTRLLIDAIQSAGVDGLTLLDIGGGLGAIQHALLDAGAQQVTSVDASAAYIHAARSEAQRRGQADRVTYRHGNFVELADQIPPADIVTLDRVICCYDDMPPLVALSAQRARKLYGVVYPRDNAWLRIGLALENVYYRLKGSAFRSYVHATHAVEAILAENGLRRLSYRQTPVWQVVVYTR
jgi:magnesium-protoporphyrin O-methyltransferase